MDSYTFWLGADDDATRIDLLESILPYVKYAAGHNLPNAAVYVDLIDRMIWPRCQVCGKPSTSDLCSFECYADYGGLPK